MFDTFPSYRRDGHPSYGTEDELAFLRSLGRWGTVSQLPRPVLLQRYLRAMTRRQRWGHIDHVQCRASVTTALAQEGPTP
jgi:hypothetical protein